MPSAAKATRLETSLAFFALAVCAWLCACLVNDSRDKAADDAFITYTYGRNLAEGHGLRYNASDPAPTSGASSLLHVLLVALGCMRGDDPLVLTRALGIAGLLAMAVGFGLIGARIARAPPVSGVLAGAAVALLVAMLPETEVHLASGMDTLLFTAVHAFAAAWAAFVVFDESERLDLEKVVGGVVSLALLALARPEGGVLAAMYVAAVVIARASPLRGVASQLRALAAVWVPVALALGALLAWQRWYFGDLFSNPYYVKSDNAIFGSDGDLLPALDTTVRVVLLRIVPLALAAAVVAVAAGATREVLRKALWLLAPSIAVVLLYAHAIHEMAGGYRYEFPMLAPLFAGLVFGLCALRRRSPRQFGAALALGVVALPMLVSPMSQTLPIWLAHPRAKSTLWMSANVPQNNALERLGLDLRDTGLGERASIVLSAAGQIPWHSRFRAIDWLGLNNDELSGRHELTVAELWQRIESERPDVAMSILPPAAPGTTEAKLDPNFTSANVVRSLGGRGSALFEHWNHARVAESFWREMLFLRDGYEFGGCYKLGNAWGDDWWAFAYVRRDSPQRAQLLSAFSNSTRCDRTSDLSKVFAFDPRKLRAP